MIPDALFIRRRGLEKVCDPTVALMGGLHMINTVPDLIGNGTITNLARQAIGMLNNDDATYAVLWLNENHSNNSFDRELFRKRLDGCQIVILGFRPAPEPTRYKTFMWPEDPTDPELVKEFTWQRHAAKVSSLRPFARQDPNIVIPDGNQRLWTARGQGRTS